MKRWAERGVWVTLVTCLVCWVSVVHAEPINSVIGDESWVVAHSEEPVEGLDGEVERIQTHLRFVLGKLRAGSESPLGEAQRARRLELLGALEDYADGGVFPQRSQGDGWGVRRPQFVDERGVHCAVGELIRVSGHGELAESLDRAYEFDVVDDMDSHELLSWAAHHGFSPRELAMIQPRYRRAPTFDEIKDSVARDLDESFERCSAVGVPVKQVVMRFESVESRAFVAKLVRPITPFTTCISDPYQTPFTVGSLTRGKIEPFNEKVRLTLPSARSFMTEKLEAMPFHRLETQCLPGGAERANPDKVRVRVVSNEHEARLDVETVPEMPDVQSCIAEYVEGKGPVQKAKWDVDVVVERDVESHINEFILRNNLAHRLDESLTWCFHEGAPEDGAFLVRARVKRAEQSIDVEVVGGTAEFGACMRARVRSNLATNLAVSRPTGDGEWERVQLIDADASAEVSHVGKTLKQLERLYRRGRRMKNRNPD